MKRFFFFHIFFFYFHCVNSFGIFLGPGAERRLKKKNQIISFANTNFIIKKKITLAEDTEKENKEK